MFCAGAFRCCGPRDRTKPSLSTTLTMAMFFIITTVCTHDGRHGTADYGLHAWTAESMPALSPALPSALPVAVHTHVPSPVQTPESPAAPTPAPTAASTLAPTSASTTASTPVQHRAHSPPPPQAEQRDRSHLKQTSQLKTPHPDISTDPAAGQTAASAPSEPHLSAPGTYIGPRTAASTLALTSASTPASTPVRHRAHSPPPPQAEQRDPSHWKQTSQLKTSHPFQHTGVIAVS
jgi:hypothetical protein